MWEFRLVWTAGKPTWWDAAWSRGIETLARRHRNPEERPDLYLVLPDRIDIGLKLRGGAEGDFDAKALHSSTNGWELWEKIAFFKWDDLEAVRFAAMLRLRVPSDQLKPAATPTAGATELLKEARLATSEIRVRKKRIQAAAGDLLASVGIESLNPRYLAELVEIRLPKRSDPLFSVCVETMDPKASGRQLLRSDDALCCGYPELLVRHLTGRL